MSIFLTPHPNIPRTSVNFPVTAAAAAIAGLTKCVRPSRPCRPSKFRLDVDAQRSPGSSLSVFMAIHIEQPGERHSNPASVRILSRPSSSACCFTNQEPGTTIARTLSDTLRPLATSAAALISSIRPLVQEPMKTRSTGIPAIFIPARSPM